jgi:hypothetical protein
MIGVGILIFGNFCILNYYYNLSHNIGWLTDLWVPLSSDLPEMYHINNERKDIFLYYISFYIT